MDWTSSGNGDIVHVSDTALMVAACRATETEEPDAFVRDPFAARLAGERGFAILEGVPHNFVMRFGMAVRTRFLDELLAEVLAEDEITTVLSVGCGLDTRPWRLELPSSLRWVEVDFPAILDYKYGLMAGEKPHCRVERLSVDLNDAAQRRTLYEAAGSDRALMITEGLLLYLPGSTVEALAAEARSQSSVAHWISDITTTGFSQALGGAQTKVIGHVQATDHLPGEKILEVLQGHGWKTASWRSYLKDLGFAQERIRRVMGGPPTTPPPFPPEDPTGIHRFSRA